VGWLEPLVYNFWISTLSALKEGMAWNKVLAFKLCVCLKQRVTTSKNEPKMLNI
jgi:hypothetical protein